MNLIWLCGRITHYISNQLCNKLFVTFFSLCMFVQQASHTQTGFMWFRINFNWHLLNYDYYIKYHYNQLPPFYYNTRNRTSISIFLIATKGRARSCNFMTYHSWLSLLTQEIIMMIALVYNCISSGRRMACDICWYVAVTHGSPLRSWLCNCKGFSHSKFSMSMWQYTDELIVWKKCSLIIGWITKGYSEPSN
jgi:hypothetical protein